MLQCLIGGRVWGMFEMSQAILLVSDALTPGVTMYGYEEMIRTYIYQSMPMITRSLIGCGV